MDGTATFEMTLQRMKVELASTAAAVGPKATKVVPGPNDGPQGCDGSKATADQTRFHQPALVTVFVQKGAEKDLLPTVESHWREKGYDVDTSHLSEVQPQLRATTRHMRFTATARTDLGTVLLGGETACLPTDGTTP